MPAPITRNPPPARSTGLLVDLATPLGADVFATPAEYASWAREGIQFQPWSFGLPTADESNCESVYVKNAEDGLPAWIDQLPFLLWRSLQCSALSGYRANLAERINYSMTTLVSFSLAAELETGTASGGIGLIGNVTYAPTVATAGVVSLREGMAALEAHLADTLHGATGMIHLTAPLYALAVSDDLVVDGRTGTGHLVVGDAGHTGLATPNGAGAPGAGQAWIYATDNVGYLLSPTTPMFEGIDGETFDFTRNVDRPLMERHALLVFDPNVTGAVLVNEFV